MNKKFFSLMIMFPLLVTDTGQSFTQSIDRIVPRIEISLSIAKAAVLPSDLNRLEPFILTARGGQSPKCRRTGLGCK
ncbi:hypothetical protein H6S82_09760 [Planktothrix sp. FACHB-1355]|uniref:Uncharacterized protein n=1 Tax=Aerosakkonema funiforme FACHB-1375 TaxID=2949571 RepID=A0A926ZJV9_9CYAN|nr:MULTISPECIES: hypothetical protein [Oscillatoriales]MBD2185079.1 hypothetical protein [Aerosakkonema funiforme FACHB-1375]MBD3559144.1 hypothetical protein [Planktothrix sp. FACHB-1355]